MAKADFGSEEELIATVRRDLGDVESALAKLEEGTYGVCETCGEPLGEERLSSSPAERFCAGHERPPSHPSLDRDSGRAQDVHR
ncbi:MAG: TraR/DksA C4-type zinc finger protein [Actinomycetota bacterium]|nr:TraR/DksA C4-type zinc finger protein [Actinomycetota bacterium]